MMVSKLVLPAVFGTIGFLACLLVKRQFALRHQGLDMDSLAFSSEAGNITGLDHLPGHIPGLCDQADRLHALLISG